MMTSHKGKILRVKYGYNPNSSSMGSLIYALPLSLMAATGGFALISSLIFSWFLHGNPPEKDKEPPES